MMTVVKSPQARLREELGLPARVSSSRVNSGDWMGLNTGDTVTEIDGRHTGRVEAIHHGAYVVVRWHETRWIETLELRQLQKVTP
jgi:hypothetical protein